MKIPKIFILFLLLLIKNQCDDQNNYVILKFKTKLDLNELNKNTFIEKTLEQNIYIDLDIGTPPQKIPMTIKTWQYPTFVFSEDVKNVNIKTKFNQNKSQTYEATKTIIEKSYKYDCTKGYISKDVFNINSKNIDFKFILGLDPSTGLKDISGEIGLSRVNEKVISSDPYSQYSKDNQFTQQLVDKKLIKDKMFGIVYDTEYEGRIIFGQYLNEVDKNYNAEEMVQTPNMDHSDTGNDNFEKWLMKFDLKCLSGIDKKDIYNESSFGFFDFEKGLIIGSNNFWVNFAQPYFDKKGCYGTPKEGNILINFNCSKEEQFQDFPDIVLSYQGNYVFNLTKNDLFKKVDDVYIFLIVFENLDLPEPRNYWRIGKPFFKKYAVFLKEQDERSYEMSYFLNKYAPYKEDDGSVATQTVVIIVLSCVVAILIAAIVVYFVYFYPKQRKKRAQELNDDYDYNPKEEPKDKLIDEE